VDQAQRGQGFGELLLIDALRRCLRTKDIGWMAIVVDAKDEKAMAFYERYHFIRFSPNSNRLFLPRTTIVTLEE
jgi:GNAT superfamily N-acetyltransferase